MGNDRLNAVAPAAIAGAGLFIDHHAFKAHVATCATMFFRNRAAHDPRLSGCVPEFPVDNTLIDPAFDVGGKLVREEAVGHVCNMRCSSLIQLAEGENRLMGGSDLTLFFEL